MCHVIYKFKITVSAAMKHGVVIKKEIRNHWTGDFIVLNDSNMSLFMYQWHSDGFPEAGLVPHDLKTQGDRIQ